MPHVSLFWRAMYQRLFETRPWATLAVTNGALTLLADGLAQSFDRRSEGKPIVSEWDVARSGRFLAFGTAMAPLLAEWNHFIEHSFRIKSPSGKMLWGGLMRRVLVDQLAFAPFGLALFVGSMGVMEGRRSLSALEDKFRDVYGPALLANWKIWPALQMLNFSIMPLRFRVPFSATCGIAWTLYLSLLNQTDVPPTNK